MTIRIMFGFLFSILLMHTKFFIIIIVFYSEGRKQGIGSIKKGILIVGCIKIITLPLLSFIKAIISNKQVTVQFNRKRIDYFSAAKL